MFELMVVTIKNKVRCVYINNYRIVGVKPYVSEGGEYKDYHFGLDDLRAAFPELEINLRSNSNG